MPAFAALAPLLARLGVAGAEAGAARGAASAAGSSGTVAREAAAKAPRMNKADKARDAFDKLFVDHPSNQAAASGGGGGPPPPPGGGGGGGALPGKFIKAVNSIDLFDKKLGEAADMAEHWSNATTNAANNRFIPMLQDILPKNMGRLVTATHQVVDAFIQRGKELSQFSGQLSAAGAVSDVRETLADIREARALEGPVSQMTNDSSKIWVEIRDLILPIKRTVTVVIADLLHGMSALLEIVADSGAVEAIETQTAITEAVWKSSFGLLSVIAENTKPDKSKEASDIEKLIETMMPLKFGDIFPADEQQANIPGALNIPLLGGI